MCGICGCDVTAGPDPAHASLTRGAGDSHHHDHTPHLAGHRHAHEERGEIVRVEQAILGKNDRLAAENRGFFRGRGVFALNVISGPGSGKTSLIERTVTDIGKELSISVIEGDLATERDADRVRAAGARVVQINTGSVCHLDAHMIGHAAEDLELRTGATLIIENVGNLVCPALFDLGEQERLVLWSITEGEDKPLKYPHVFAWATAVMLHKIDLLPHLRFDIGQARAFVGEVAPRARLLEASAMTGEGMAGFYDWLRERARAVGGAPKAAP